MERNACRKEFNQYLWTDTQDIVVGRVILAANGAFEEIGVEFILQFGLGFRIG
jgi:hypothetical protein